MMEAKKEIKRVQGWMQEFGKSSPDSMKCFQALMQAVDKEKVLDAKTKELMAIAISVTQQCEWCIAHHVNNALEEGATREEIIESAWVSVRMGGRPGPDARRAGARSAQRNGSRGVAANPGL